MIDEQTAKAPQLLSSENFIILRIIEDYRKGHYQDVDAAIRALKNEIDNWASSKKFPNKYILEQMEAILKTFLLFHESLPDIEEIGVNLICSAGFTSMLKLLDEHTQKKLEQILDTAPHGKYLSYSKLNRCISNKQNILNNCSRLDDNRHNFTLNYFNGQFFTPGVDTIDARSSIMGCLLDSPSDLNLKFKAKFLCLVQDGWPDNLANQLIKIVEDALSPEEKTIRIIAMMQTVLNFFYANYIIEQNYVFEDSLKEKEYRELLGSIFEKMYFMLDDSVKQEFQKWIQTKEARQAIDFHSPEALEQRFIKLKEACKNALAELKKHNLDAEIIDKIENQINAIENPFQNLPLLGNLLEFSSFKQRSQFLIDLNNNLNDLIEKYNLIDILVRYRYDTEQYCLSQEPPKNCSPLLLPELFLQNFFETYCPKSNDDMLQKLAYIKHFFLNTFLSVESLPIDAQITAYFDSNFLQNIFCWKFHFIEDTNHFEISASEDDPFKIKFTSENKTFFNPEELSITIILKESPFPEEMYNLIKNALIAKDIKFARPNNWEFVIEKTSIESKAKLASIIEVINNFANFNKTVCENLELMLALDDPESKISALLNKGEYDAALEEALLAEKKGYKDCVWKAAEMLSKEYELAFEEAQKGFKNAAEMLSADKQLYTAFAFYGHVDKNNPHYAEALKKRLETLLKTNAEILDKSQQIELLEDEFRECFKLCKFDPSYAKLRDKIFAELRGDTDLFASVHNTISNLENILELATKILPLKNQIVLLEEELKKCFELCKLDIPYNVFKSMIFQELRQDNGGLSVSADNIESNSEKLLKIAKEIRELKTSKSANPSPANLMATQGIFVPASPPAQHQSEALNGDLIKKRLETLYGCAVKPIKCNDTLLQINFEGTIPKDLQAALNDKDYSEIYYKSSKSESGFCITEKAQMLDFAGLIEELAMEASIQNNY